MTLLRETVLRPSHRRVDELRPITMQTGYAPYAEGSCLIQCGNTHVLCTATVEEKVPPFMRNSGQGWLTAEYGMLPRCSPQRIEREAAKGKQTGRTQEIQRLIGRSLRAALDMQALGERQIRIDCDVLQADGGTRTAAITGGYVALHQACSKLLAQGLLKKLPLITQVAAVSCGITLAGAVLDLDYQEDSSAEVDANFILTSDQRIIEVQAAAEGAPFTRAMLDSLLSLAESGTAQLFALQRKALGLDNV